MKTFNLPDLGEGLQEAEIVEWKVKEGDTVNVDDPLVAVETAKAVVDVPSPEKGVVARLHAADGDMVEVGKPLVDFDDGSGAGSGEAPAKSEPEPEPQPEAAAAQGAKAGGGSATFNLPDLGEGLQEAEIVEWKVKEGDTVNVDDPLVAVETAKAVVDVPSPEKGTITRLHAADGDVVEVGKPLVDFATEGGAPAGDSGGKAAGDEADKTAEDSGKREDAGSVVGKMEAGGGAVEQTAIVRKKGKQSGKGKTGGARIKALPAVRRRAKELGVDLSRVTASGNRGQITMEDVEKATAGTSARGPAPATMQTGLPETPMAPPRDDVAYGEPQPLRGPRRAMHQSMSASRDQVAACTLFDDADIHYWQPGQDITARIIRALVAGVRAEPGLNAWYDGEKRERTIHKHVDLAMAVDTEDGLIVPVLRQVDQKDTAGLRQLLNQVKQETRDRAVAPEDMKNPTITLSNFGMMAGRYATPVVVPPQVAILGTGGIRHDVVPVMGGMECHKRIPLSITFDHRCLTGGEACRFLKGVIDDLQRPY